VNRTAKRSPSVAAGRERMSDGFVAVVSHGLTTNRAKGHVVASAPQSREEFFDPGRLFVGRESSSASMASSSSGVKSCAVSRFPALESFERRPANDIELLAQRSRPRPASAAHRQSGSSP